MFTDPQKLICTDPVDHGATASITPRTAARVAEIAAWSDPGGNTPETHIPNAASLPLTASRGPLTGPMAPPKCRISTIASGDATSGPATARIASTVSGASRCSRVPPVACADGTVGSL